MAYSTDVYRKQGGAQIVVASGGDIQVESGGTVTLQSGGLLNIESGGGINPASGGLLGRVAGATMTVGAEGADAITVAIQFTDAAGDDLDERASVFAYLSNDSGGDTLTDTPVTSIAAGTDGVYIPVVANKAGHIISESDGDMDLTITYSGSPSAATWYLVLILPSGQLAVSDAVTFA